MKIVGAGKPIKIRDPGRWLLRFPFCLLPARWVLNRSAMLILIAAKMRGIGALEDEPTR
jgi:hypothetical protein